MSSPVVCQETLPTPKPRAMNIIPRVRNSIFYSNKVILREKNAVLRRYEDILESGYRNAPAGATPLWVRYSPHRMNALMQNLYDLSSCSCHRQDTPLILPCGCPFRYPTKSCHCSLKQERKTWMYKNSLRQRIHCGTAGQIRVRIILH